MNTRIQSAGIHPFQASATPGEPPAVRRPCQDKLFVQVILCGSRPDLVGRTWSCRAVTTEPQALEFLCARALPSDALVDLWVDLSERPGRFFLSGFVQSAALDEDGRHRIRVLLEEGAATDIDEWIASQA